MPAPPIPPAARRPLPERPHGHLRATGRWEGRPGGRGDSACRPTPRNLVLAPAVSARAHQNGRAARPAPLFHEGPRCNSPAPPLAPQGRPCPRGEWSRGGWASRPARGGLPPPCGGVVAPHGGFGEGGGGSAPSPRGGGTSPGPPVPRRGGPPPPRASAPPAAARAACRPRRARR